MEKIITDAARVLISMITLLFVSFVISSVAGADSEMLRPERGPLQGRPFNSSL